jgi:hypothetical protein
MGIIMILSKVNFGPYFASLKDVLTATGSVSYYPKKTKLKGYQKCKKKK